MVKGNVQKLVGLVCGLCLAVFSDIPYGGPSLFFFGELPYPKEEK